MNTLQYFDRVNRTSDNKIAESVANTILSNHNEIESMYLHFHEVNGGDNIGQCDIYYKALNKIEDWKDEDFEPIFEIEYIVTMDIYTDDEDLNKFRVFKDNTKIDNLPR